MIAHSRSKEQSPLVLNISKTQCIICKEDKTRITRGKWYMNIQQNNRLLRTLQLWSDFIVIAFGVYQKLIIEHVLHYREKYLLKHRTFCCKSVWKCMGESNWHFIIILIKGDKEISSVKRDRVRAPPPPSENGVWNEGFAKLNIYKCVQI